MTAPEFRYAAREDTPLILEFIKGLAEYEQQEVEADEASLRTWLFDKEKAEVIFVLEGEKEVGFVLFYHNFSTFLGKSGLYVEDLYVLPEYRGKGYGTALLSKLASVALERKCARLEYRSLDWTRDAVEFHLAIGATPLHEWTVYRIDGDTLQQLSLLRG